MNQLVALINIHINMGQTNDIRFICDDGFPIYVTLCGYGDIKSINDCDYFLVDGDMPWLGGSKVDDVLKVINNHSQMKSDSDEEKEKLRAYKDKYEKLGWPEDTYEFYSDWHKDVHGHRPRF